MEPLRKEGKQPTDPTSHFAAIWPQWSPSERRGSRRRAGGCRLLRGSASMEPLRKEGKQTRRTPRMNPNPKTPQWSPSERKGSRSARWSCGGAWRTPQWSPSERRGSRLRRSPPANVRRAWPQWSPSERRGSSQTPWRRLWAASSSLNGAPPKGGEADRGACAARRRQPAASMEPLRKEGKQPRNELGVALHKAASMEPLRKEGKQPGLGATPYLALPQWSPSERRGSSRR